MREKKRYLVYEIISERPLKDPTAAIMRHISSTLGLFDSAAAGVLPVKYDKKRGIIRMNHKYMDKVKCSLMLMNQLDGEDITIQTLGVSGMIKKAELKYIAS
ncbi:MAG: Rpp14/Pop5 family protein [Nanoarchaeota archaeon]